MLKKSTIACVIDLSAACRQSLPSAAKLAKDMDARLVILYPVPWSHWSIYTLMSYNSEREAAEAVRKAEPIVREIMNMNPEVEWELRVETGDTQVIIKTLAKEPEIEMVVSARRKGPLQVLKSSPSAKPASLETKCEMDMTVSHSAVIAAVSSTVSGGGLAARP